MPEAGLEHTLATRVVEAARRAWDLQLRHDEALIRPSSPGRGADYQSNLALSLAKRLSKPSPLVAAELVAAVDIDDIVESVSVAGRASSTSPCVGHGLRTRASPCPATRGWESRPR